MRDSELIDFFQREGAGAAVIVDDGLLIYNGDLRGIFYKATGQLRAIVENEIGLEQILKAKDLTAGNRVELDEGGEDHDGY